MFSIFSYTYLPFLYLWWSVYSHLLLILFPPIRLSYWVVRLLFFFNSGCKFLIKYMFCKYFLSACGVGFNFLNSTSLCLLWKPFFLFSYLHFGLPCGSVVKNPPTIWETWVQSLGWEDPLERERLPIPVFWPGEFHGLYSPSGHKESDMTEWLSLTFFWVDFFLT